MSNNEKGPKMLRFEALDKIEKPDPNIVIEKLRVQFRPVLVDYCESVPSLVLNNWKNTKTREYSLDDLSTDIQQETQGVFEQEFAGKINAALQNEMLNLVADYAKDLRACVSALKPNLADSAEKAIYLMLDSESAKFHFDNVELETVRKVTLCLWTDKAKVERVYSSAYIDELLGNDIKLGMFDEYLIQKPAMEYSRQINAWANRIIDDITRLYIVNITKDANKWSMGF